jgi:hypothetical protein
MTAGLGPYLRGLVRRKAPAGRGIIASFVSPGVYMVTLETSKWPVRATVAQAGATFAIGQVVWLMQSDATGATQNTEYIIGGLANSTSKNASVNQGYETTPFVLAPSVSVISPNPCPACARRRRGDGIDPRSELHEGADLWERAYHEQHPGSRYLDAHHDQSGRGVGTGAGSL